MIGIYINNERLDTFKDESVKYKGKLVDAQDIEKIFTDSTNSFTVPASKRNNKVFSNWFTIGVNGAYDSNKRQPAYLELNTVPYKEGVIQLDGVGYKNGKAEYYKISFYGELLSLSDRFGDDELKDLDTSDLDYNFNEGMLKFLYFNDGIGPRPVGYLDRLNLPLIIPADETYTLNDNEPGDIANNTSIPGYKLRPGICEYTLMEKIQEKYDIKFNCSLFNKPAVRKSYLWLNGTDEYDEALSWWTYRFNGTSFQGQNDGNGFELIDDKKTLYFRRDNQYLMDNVSNPNKHLLWFWSIYLNMTLVPIEQNVEYKVRIYDKQTESVLWTMDEYRTGNYNLKESSKFLFIPSQSGSNVVENRFQIQIKSLSKIDMKINTTVESFVGFDYGVGTLSFVNLNNNSNINGINSKYIISKSFPEYSVADYFKDFIKKYKIIITANGDKEFDLIPLNDFFDSGNTIDLSNQIKIDEYDAENKITFKKIEFKKEESDLVLQKNFRDVNGRNYGEYILKNNSDGKEKKVELKESNLMLNLLTDEVYGYTLPVAYAMEKNGAEFEPKPNDGIFFYYKNPAKNIKKENGALPFEIKIEFSKGNISESAVLSQIGTSDSNNLNQVTQTVNWYKEADINFGGIEVDKSYYTNYWKRWIDANNNKDNRVMNFRGFLTNNQMRELELNTEIIINNDAFSINEYDLNLSTNEIELKLIPSLKRTQEYYVDNVSPSNFFSSFDGTYGQLEIEIKDEWVIEKKNNGDGTTWLVILDDTSDKGKKDVGFRIADNSNLQSDRSMQLLVRNTKTQQTYSVNVEQRK